MVQAEDADEDHRHDGSASRSQEQCANSRGNSLQSPGLERRVEAGQGPGEGEQPLGWGLDDHRCQDRENHQRVEDDHHLKKTQEAQHTDHHTIAVKVAPRVIEEIERLSAEGTQVGRQGVVGSVIVRADGRCFAQRRSMTRQTFPGCWDLVGGHVEDGESLFEALNREVWEETGWVVAEIVGLLKVVDWETPGDLGPIRKREFVFAVTVEDRWDRPDLETTKVSEGRWFSPDEAELLNENRPGSDRYVYDLVKEYWSRPRASRVGESGSGT